jgi:hypothetical protein
MHGLPLAPLACCVSCAMRADLRGGQRRGPRRAQAPERDRSSMPSYKLQEGRPLVSCPVCSSVHPQAGSSKARLSGSRYSEFLMEPQSVTSREWPNPSASGSYPLYCCCRFPFMLDCCSEYRVRAPFKMFGELHDACLCYRLVSECG